VLLSVTTSGMTNDLNRAADGTSEISGELADISGRLNSMVAAFRY